MLHGNTRTTLAAILLTLLASACGGAPSAVLTPPPASALYLVTPADYSNGSWGATASASSAYVAGSTAFLAQPLADYSVAISSEPSGAPAHAGSLHSSAAATVRRTASALAPVSREESAALEIHKRGPMPRRSAAAPPARPAPVASYSEGQTRSFWICNRPFASCNASNQIQLTATAIATTAKAAVFLDNADLNTVPADRLRQLADAAEQFWASITGVLGLPQNQYNPDGNGQIIYLFTSKVGQIDPNLAGFFFSPDLYPDADTVQYWDIHSNEANMVYLNAASGLNPSVMAHEFAHLVHYSRRVIVNGKPPHPTYFKEGLAQVMEDVAGYGWNPPGYLKAFVSYFLREFPSVSLASWGAPPADLRSYYGAAYLWTRYLADRFGVSVLRQIIDSSLDTEPAIESVSGEPYGGTFASSALAVVNSAQRLGITDPRYRYTSIDVSAAGEIAFLAPGTQQAGSLNWRFIFARPGSTRVRVTITAGTATPYAGVVFR